MSRRFNHITQTIGSILIDGHFQILRKYFVFKSFNIFTRLRIGGVTELGLFDWNNPEHGCQVFAFDNVFEDICRRKEK